LSDRFIVARRCARLILVSSAYTALAAVAGAAGPGSTEKSFDTTRAPRISIINVNGNVVVRGWERAQVHAIYRVASPRAEVDIESFPPAGAAEKLRFSTHLLDWTLPGKDQVADYTLDVPVDSSLQIRNPQGSVRVEGIQSDSSVESVGGNIMVGDYAGHLSVQSIGGDIELVRTVGNVDAHSITGSLHFVSPAITRLRGATTSGRILYEGDFLEHGEYILSAYSGDVEVICPVAASYELSARTVKGKVINSMPITRRRESATPAGSAYSLLGVHNAARATVELTSFSGAIRIRPEGP